MAQYINIERPSPPLCFGPEWGCVGSITFINFWDIIGITCWQKWIWGMSSDCGNHTLAVIQIGWSSDWVPTSDWSAWVVREEFFFLEETSRSEWRHTYKRMRMDQPARKSLHDLVRVLPDQSAKYLGRVLNFQSQGSRSVKCKSGPTDLILLRYLRPF